MIIRAVVVPNDLAQTIPGTIVELRALGIDVRTFGRSQGARDVLAALNLDSEGLVYITDTASEKALESRLGVHVLVHSGDEASTRRALSRLIPEAVWTHLSESTVLSDYWSVTVGRFQLPTGEVIHRNLIRHRRTAIIACLNDRNQVLLTRQYRAPFDEVMWELPGGDMEPGETPEQAAARECEEETGFRPTVVRHILTSRASPGESDAEHFICVGEGVTPGRSNLSKDELIHHYWVDLADAMQLVRSHMIRHPGALLALLYLASERPEFGAPA